MKILMLSDWETQFGGAAVAASRLAYSLCRMGHEVIRIVAVKDGRKNAWHVAELHPSIWGWAVHHFFRGWAWESFSKLEIRGGFRRFLNQYRPDFINIHNIHGATTSYGWPLELVSDCCQAAPVVWTLHDMWSFTGRCAYNKNCLKYLTGCDASCPTPTEYPFMPLDRINNQWRQKKEILHNKPNLFGVTPSKWLANSALQGAWTNKRVEIIPYGLPLDIYQPVDRDIARKALNIPSGNTIIMTAAFNFNDPRKGSDLLLNALQLSHARPLNVVTMGSGEFNVNIEGIHIQQLGYIDHERSKALAYSSADIFIHPALADNLPCTVMESIACGTPVISLDIGGLPDMVRPGKTGWLVTDISAEALAATLDQACGDVSHDTTLRNSCRDVAAAEYGDDLQASRYLSLFESILPTGK